MPTKFVIRRLPTVASRSFKVSDVVKYFSNTEQRWIEGVIVKFAAGKSGTLARIVLMPDGTFRTINLGRLTLVSSGRKP